VARALEARVLRDARPVGVVVSRARLATLVLGLAIALPGIAVAQLPEAEDAFDRGDYRTARALYDSVLSLDSLNPRALYRLAILDSWDGNLKGSLARFVRLRSVEPLQPDEMAAHAKVLSWDGQTKWSAALYDSVLAIDSTRADAMAGRARAVAWGGDLNRAERLWRQALERNPDDPEILVGLGQTLYWEGQPGLAESYVARARQLAPTDKTARDLLSQVRAERRPVFAFDADAANDIEHNRFVALTGSFSGSLQPDLRGTVRAVWRQNDDNTNTTRSDGLDGWLAKSFASGTSARAGLGVRALHPDNGPTLTFATVQAGFGLRPASFASVTVNYNRYPFDETRLLVDSGFVWDELSADLGLLPRPNLDVSVGVNSAWLSDGNRRLNASAVAILAVARRVRAGVYLRILGYREANPGRGYFAPDRFLTGEGRLVYAWRRPGWWLRATGGLGAQQVGSSGPAQAEWHGELTVAHAWRSIDELALVGTYTNSAAAQTATATTTTYRYWSVGLRYQRGF
jgi:tetratricopeptide (TPR) repeat protein